MKKAKIAIVSLGHYVYFQQFEGLREDLTKKSEHFRSYLNFDVCDVVDVGYVDCAELAFEAVQKLKKEDAIKINEKAKGFWSEFASFAVKGNVGKIVTVLYPAPDAQCPITDVKLCDEGFEIFFGEETFKFDYADERFDVE